MSKDRPAVSVLVVSDYGGRTAEEWGYLRDTLGGLAAQEFDEEVEILLVDSTPAGEDMPEELRALIPSMRVVEGASEPTWRLLNRAVETSSAALVALLDGDCAPAPGWLRAGVDASRARADAAAVSGLTVYPGRTFTNRVLGLLSRSFVDPGRAGRARFITGNNAIFRRDVLVAHPLREFNRAMAARLQAEAIRLDGGGLYFEPEMRVTHRFEGWSMERRIRRRVGYRAIRVRQIEPRLPFAGMIRFGTLSIPLVLAARTVDSCWDCIRARHHYGLRRHELPAAFALAVAVHLMEIPGMIEAVSEASRPRTAAEGGGGPRACRVSEEARPTLDAAPPE
jgi:hypothetical protein